MIIEDYVSFETAKLLKEKGFDEKCNASYRDYTSSHDMNHWITITFDEEETDDMKFICYAPTLYKAMKWLREVHNIHVVPKFDFYAGDYTGRIYDGRRESAAEKDDYIAIVGNNTYEQASESAIKYCLENLI